MPTQWPVYVRERSSRLYTPGVYFLATWASTTLAYIIFQPLVYATMSFIYVDFQNSSIENYAVWLSILTIQGMNGSTFGFMYGNYISDPIMCIMISYFGLVLIYFGGGAFTNYKGEETLI